MDWTYNTIWNEQLEEGEFFHVSFGSNEKRWSVPLGGSYYIIDDFKPKSKKLTELNGVHSPKYLELNRSNIESFHGVQACAGVKRLELHYCTKLESDKGISELSQDLEWLHINKSKKFAISDELQTLSKLKVLCLNDCAPLESLDFIHAFPDLVDLRFVGTDVVDGKLQQLYDCEKLLNVAFSNKRHFDCKYDALKLHFQQKNELAKTYVYKGDFSTFQYHLFRNQHAHNK